MKYFLILAFMVLLGASCKKDPAAPIFTLPAVTTDGLKTLGFEHGSDVFVNYGNICFSGDSCRPNTDAFFRWSDGQVRLQADKVVKRGTSVVSSETIAMYVATDHRGMMIYDSQLGDILSMAYGIDKGGVSTIYMLDPQKPVGIVALTRIDTTTGILSGTFSASLFRKDAGGFAVVPTDSFVIRNGRFDLKYK